jgi:hypothetical protein
MNEELLQLLQSGFASGYSEDRLFAMAIDQGFSYNDVTLALESFSKKKDQTQPPPQVTDTMASGLEGSGLDLSYETKADGTQFPDDLLAQRFTQSSAPNNKPQETNDREYRHALIADDWFVDRDDWFGRTARWYNNFMAMGLATGAQEDLLDESPENNVDAAERLAYYNEIQNKYRDERGYPGWEDFGSASGWWKTVLPEVMGNFFSSTVGAVASGGSQETVLKSIAEGQAVGTSAGLAGGPLAEFTVPIGYAAGTAYGAAVGGAYAGSYALEMSEAISLALEDLHIDTEDPEEIAQTFESEEGLKKIKEAMERRKVRAAVIASVDALLAGGGGTTAQAIRKAGGSKTKAVVAEILVDAAGGAAGETAGQIVEEGKVTSGLDIVMEALGGPVMATPAAVTRGASARYTELMTPTAERNYIQWAQQNKANGSSITTAASLMGDGQVQIVEKKIQETKEQLKNAKGKEAKQTLRDDLKQLREKKYEMLNANIRAFEELNQDQQVELLEKSQKIFALQQEMQETTDTKLKSRLGAEILTMMTGFNTFEVEAVAPAVETTTMDQMQAPVMPTTDAKPIVEGRSEVDALTINTLEDGTEVIAQRPIDGTEVQGALRLEGNPENPTLVVETETEKVELGQRSEVDPSTIRMFEPAIAERETLAVQEDGSFVYQRDDNPNVPQGTKLTIDEEAGVSAISVFGEGQFNPLQTPEAIAGDADRGVRVQMKNESGEVVELYGQDALDAAYQILLAAKENPADRAKVNQVIENNEAARQALEQAEREFAEEGSVPETDGPTTEQAQPSVGPAPRPAERVAPGAAEEAASETEKTREAVNELDDSVEVRGGAVNPRRHGVTPRIASMLNSAYNAFVGLYTEAPRVIIHKTKESLQRATGGPYEAFYEHEREGGPAIHVMYNATTAAIREEFAHAGLRHVMVLQPAVRTKLFNDLQGINNETLRNKINERFRKYVAFYMERGASEAKAVAIAEEEAIVGIIADINDNLNQIDASAKAKTRRVINKMLGTKLGKFHLKSNNDLVNMIERVTQGYRTGNKIYILDIVRNAQPNPNPNPAEAMRTESDPTSDDRARLIDFAFDRDLDLSDMKKLGSGAFGYAFMVKDKDGRDVVLKQAQSVDEMYIASNYFDRFGGKLPGLAQYYDVAIASDVDGVPFIYQLKEYLPTSMTDVVGRDGVTSQLSVGAVVGDLENIAELLNRNFPYSGSLGPSRGISKIQHQAMIENMTVAKQLYQALKAARLEPINDSERTAGSGFVELRLSNLKAVFSPILNSRGLNIEMNTYQYLYEHLFGLDYYADDRLVLKPDVTRAELSSALLRKHVVKSLVTDIADGLFNWGSIGTATLESLQTKARLLGEASPSSLERYEIRQESLEELEQNHPGSLEKISKLYDNNEMIFTLIDKAITSTFDVENFTAEEVIDVSMAYLDNQVAMSKSLGQLGLRSADLHPGNVGFAAINSENKIERFSSVKFFDIMGPIYEGVERGGNFPVTEIDAFIARDFKEFVNEGNRRLKDAAADMDYYTSFGEEDFAARTYYNHIGVGVIPPITIKAILDAEPEMSIGESNLGYDGTAHPKSREALKHIAKTIGLVKLMHKNPDYKLMRVLQNELFKVDGAPGVTKVDTQQRDDIYFFNEQVQTAFHDVLQEYQREAMLDPSERSNVDSGNRARIEEYLLADGVEFNSIEEIGSGAFGKAFIVNTREGGDLVVKRTASKRETYISSRYISRHNGKLPGLVKYHSMRAMFLDAANDWMGSGVIFVTKDLSNIRVGKYGSSYDVSVGDVFGQITLAVNSVYDKSTELLGYVDPGPGVRNGIDLHTAQNTALALMQVYQDPYKVAEINKYIEDELPGIMLRGESYPNTVTQEIINGSMTLEDIISYAVNFWQMAGSFTLLGAANPDIHSANLGFSKEEKTLNGFPLLEAFDVDGFENNMMLNSRQAQEDHQTFMNEITDETKAAFIPGYQDKQYFFFGQPFSQLNPVGLVGEEAAKFREENKDEIVMETAIPAQVPITTMQDVMYDQEEAEYTAGDIIEELRLPRDDESPYSNKDPYSDILRQYDYGYTIPYLDGTELFRDFRRQEDGSTADFRAGEIAELLTKNIDQYALSDMIERMNEPMFRATYSSRFKDIFETREKQRASLVSALKSKLDYMENGNRARLDDETVELAVSKISGGKRVSPARATSAGSDVKLNYDGSRQISMDYTRENAPAVYVRGAFVLGTHTMMSDIKGTKALDTKNPTEAQLKKADEIYEIFVERATKNLIRLHDSFSEDVRKYSKLWYVGANLTAQDMGARYGYSQEQAAGILAALSPQKDWYQNMALAEAVMRVMRNQKDTEFSKAMYNKALGNTRKVNNKVLSQQDFKKAVNEKAYQAYLKRKAVLQSMIGKTLGEMSLEENGAMNAAMFVRTYNEMFEDRNYHVVSPIGERIGYAKKADGSMSTMAWGSYAEISSATSIVLNGTMSNIDKQVGDQHKVRSFFNNINNPNSLEGDVTIDTHAVAAAELLPLAGSSSEVFHNFGGGTAAMKVKAGSSNLGIKGVYFAYAEAYRRAADEKGILAREMQSITWEAVRTLFTAGFKAQKKNKQEVRAIWQEYSKGNISFEEAQDQVFERAGGVFNPDWYVDSGDRARLDETRERRHARKMFQNLRPDVPFEAAVREELKRDPSRFYEPQKFSEIKERLEEMSIEELLAEMKDVAMFDGDNPSVINDAMGSLAGGDFRVLATLEYLKRLQQQGRTSEYRAVLKRFFETGTAVGQLLRQFGEIKGQTPEGMKDLVDSVYEANGTTLSDTEYEEMGAIVDDLFDGQQDVQALIKELSETTDMDRVGEIEGRLEDAKRRVSEANKRLNEFNSKYAMTWGKLIGLLIQGNLLTPVSQMVNVTANLSTLPILMLDKTLGYGAEVLINGIRKSMGKDVDPSIASLPPSITAAIYAGKQFGVGIKDAYKSAIGETVPNDKFEYNMQLQLAPIKAFGLIMANSDKLPDAVKNGTKLDQIDYRAKKFLEAVGGTPANLMFRLLAFGDVPFFKFMEGYELYRVGKSLGLSGDELNRFLKYPNEEYRNKATQAGLKVTFQEDNQFATWLNKAITRTADLIGERSRVLENAFRVVVRMHMPYVKTPANILAQSIQLAHPAIPIATIAIKKAARGRVSQRELAELLSKAFMSWLMYKATQRLMESGLITTPVDADVARERDLKYSVAPPNSINITGINRLLKGEDPTLQANDVWFNYQKLGLGGAVMAAQAVGLKSTMRDAQMESRVLNRSDNFMDYLADLTGVVPGVLGSMMNQSFLTGIDGIIKLLADPSERQLTKYLENISRSGFSVILPNSLSAFYRSGREYLPDYRHPNADFFNVLDNILRDKTFNYLGTGEQVIPRVNIWGESITQTPEGGGSLMIGDGDEYPWLYNTFGVFKSRISSTDPVKVEIYNLFKETGDTDVIPGYPMPVGKLKIQLTKSESAYYGLNVNEPHYIDVMPKDAHAMMKMFGTYRYNEIKKFVSSDSYERMTNAQKISALKSIYNRNSRGTYDGGIYPWKAYRDGMVRNYFLDLGDE